MHLKRTDIRLCYEVAQFEQIVKDLRYTRPFPGYRGVPGSFSFDFWNSTEDGKVINQPSILEEVVWCVCLKCTHILAEANYSKDKEKALDYLNAVRGVED